MASLATSRDISATEALAIRRRMQLEADGAEAYAIAAHLRLRHVGQLISAAVARADAYARLDAALRSAR